MVANFALIPLTFEQKRQEVIKVITSITNDPLTHRRTRRVLPHHVFSAAVKRPGVLTYERVTLLARLHRDTPQLMVVTTTDGGIGINSTQRPDCFDVSDGCAVAFFKDDATNVDIARAYRWLRT
ncbi:MAG: hypothetical protein ABIR91_01485 [Candidatus Saccharimonadales bacterium]